MRSNFPRLAVGLTCLVLMTACPDGAERRALSPYAQGTLTPGVGLGDLQLGKTTLGWFVQTIGSGRVSVLFSDETAIELSFLDGEASFSFIVSGTCQTETGAPRQRLEVSQDLKAFLSRYPSCNELPLSSVSVATGRSRQADTFFQGSTDRGVQLWSPQLEAYQHGAELTNPGQLVAGEGPDGDQFDRLEFPGGIYFYSPVAGGTTPQEVKSGQPLLPERSRQVEASTLGGADQAVITRMTVFIPDQ